MAYNRQVLKVISIVQLVMASFFLTLGILDGLEVRFYTSLLFIPCWIAALVLPAGVMGLVLSIMSKPSQVLIIALKSISMACAGLSLIAVYQYQVGLGTLLTRKRTFDTSFFAVKETKIRFAPQEKNMLTVYSLVIAFSIIEIMLSFASVKCLGSGSERQEESLRQAGHANLQMENGQIPLQPIYIASQPVVTVPITSYTAN